MRILGGLIQHFEQREAWINIFTQLSSSTYIGKLELASNLEIIHTLYNMTESTATGTNGTTNDNAAPKKKILLNAFDMSTVGHLSPGQWKV